MSALAREQLPALSPRRWHDPAAWSTTADVFAILIAVALPWSTSLASISAAAFLVSMAPFFDVRAFLRSLQRPVCALPIALLALALAGTLWSNVSWAERFYAVGPSTKFLMLPVLFYHFERSARGRQVFIAFLASCAALMAMSWIVAFDPRLALKSGAEYGVPVKNYIDQSQEFALCAVALAYPVIGLLRARRIWPATLLAALSLSFVVNMLFVSVSRTALVTIPLMLAVFALLHLKWRSIVIIGCATAVLGGLAWATSPPLRRTTATFLRDYQLYKERNIPTSIGLRLMFWEKSLRFISEAPLFGHGTGSIRALFEEDAVGQFGAAAEVVANPHNQTLSVGIQWGAIGIVLLFAMWLVHLSLFRGEGLAAWIGLMVVLQNIFTSAFNSHLFDFNEGWMYVLGVGIAGSMVLAARSQASVARESAGP
ncbi:MAG TPA: O-antigen ligase family protein [Bradyrhizobium sp.]|uniref:O-antigen ligase family protein n=1 Tax=Bradyrhizobium sp. TaxID=376 RepID=UPI002B662093|nr:O-antigen ligase family protein [Bradyrhizobium sp.]HTB02834.1 O-antigen ligase family protein [Bradyrhizobium sp.]